MKVRTTARLGKSQELTPEGFLLCRDVAIARTGTLLYRDGEIPVEAGPDGIIRITRSAREVFSEDAVASFAGKALTDDHPPTDVTASNWSTLAKGTILNPRRGEGIEDDFLFADILVQDAAAIDAIRSGKREVSCGYEADYFQTGPGYGEQKNIRGNHVALVERGRCGSRCAIGDSEPVPVGEQDMTVRNLKPNRGAVKATLDGIAKAFGFKDAEEMNAATGDEESPEDADKDKDKDKEGESAKTGDAATTFDAAAFGTAIATAVVAGLKPTLDAIASNTAKPETPAAATKDELAVLSGALTDFRGRAELLSPGYKPPTHDAAAVSPQATRDHLCACQRAVLANAYATDDGKAAVEPFLAGRSLDALDAAAVEAIFLGASEVARARNNAKAAAGLGRPIQFGDATTGKTVDTAEMNRKHREFWAARSGSAQTH